MFTNGEMNMQVLILNAPPHCGKDTIANLLKEYGYVTTEFKAPMFDIAFAMSGMSKDSFMLDYNNRFKKEAPQQHLGGLSYREFMIHISEDVMKPLFGNAVFGERASSLCLSAEVDGYDVVFSDGGFIDEVKELSDDFEVTVIRLHREGYTFEGDSRQYLYPDFCKSTDVYLVENKPLLAVEEILELINA